MYWNWSLKISDWSHLGPIWPNFNAKFEIRGQQQLTDRWQSTSPLCRGILSKRTGVTFGPKLVQIISPNGTNFEFLVYFCSAQQANLYRNLIFKIITFSMLSQICHLCVCGCSLIPTYKQSLYLTIRWYHHWPITLDLPHTHMSGTARSDANNNVNETFPLDFTGL